MTHIRRLWAPIALVATGVVAIFGSFRPWDTCPDSACYRPGFSFMAFWPTSGVEFGPGWATVILGVLLIVIGLLAAVAPRRARLAGHVCGLLVVATVILFFLFMHVFSDLRYYGPNEGWFLVGIAGLAAIGVSRRLRA